MLKNLVSLCNFTYNILYVKPYGLHEGKDLNLHSCSISLPYFFLLIIFPFITLVQD